MPGGLSTKKIRVFLFLGYPSVHYAFRAVCSGIQTCRLGSISDHLDLCGTAPAAVSLNLHRLQLASFFNSHMDKNRRTRASIEQPAIHCQDLRWPNRCSSKCSPPARSQEEAGIISQDLRGSSEDHQPGAQRRERETSPLSIPPCTA